MTNQNLKEKIEYYEQIYFSLDKPVPFKENLKIYPVLVEDYYKFHSLISCFTFNKNTSREGISMSNLEYALKLMEDEKNGAKFTAKFVSLLELVFHIKNGLYCDNENCVNDDGEPEVIYYEDIEKEIKTLEKKVKKDFKEGKYTDKKLEDVMKEEIKKYFFKIKFCEKCNRQKREVFSIREENGIKTLSIFNTEINNYDFDELKQIVCYQNMPDYEDDYIDPQLKADLEAKAKLENPNAVSPSLEKQLICVSISSPYKLEELHKITLRKLVMLLRTIDAKAHYFCYKQGEVSGMVTFKSEIKHWIFSSDKHDYAKDIMTMDAVEEKFKHVT